MALGLGACAGDRQRRHSRAPAPAATPCSRIRSSREADDGADHVRQRRPEIDRGRQLAGDIAERADDGERPAAFHALLAADEVEQDPGRQQRQDGDDLADRGREERQQLEEAAERAR